MGRISNRAKGYCRYGLRLGQRRDRLELHANGWELFRGLQETYPDKYNKLVNGRPEMDGHLAFFTIVFDRRTE